MLTLSFAGNTLRLLSVRGWEVTAWHSLLFNPALLRRGAVANPEEMAKVIANAVQSKGFTGAGGVAVAFSGQSSISRILSLPGGARPSEVIPREARRTMGAAPEESYLFWQPLSRDKRQFFVVVVPRETVRQLVETLRLAGMRPTQLDLAPLALARAANQPQAIVASVDAGLLEVAIVLDSVPVLVRTELMSEGGVAVGEGVGAAAAASLSRTLSFYNDSHRDRPLTGDIPLIIGGGQADNTDLVEKVGKELGHPLQQPALPFRFPDGFSPAPFLVNLGLALKVL